ncbi:MAG TPA: SDR family oxidoreductase [Microlunatus sp.]
MVLESQRVLVVGGSTGIGLATAQAAAEAGAEVIIASSRQDNLDKALTSLPDDSRGIVADLSDPQAPQRLIEQVGELDHLVYTAGDRVDVMPISDYDDARARAFFEVRFFGMLATVHAAAPKIRNGGSITLTSGSAGDRGGPGWSVGAAGCGAIFSLVRSLAIELAPSIRVNAVAPGAIRTPMWDVMSAAEQAELESRFTADALLSRIGEPRDTALAYLYAITQTYATGQVLRVNGGTSFG